MRLTATWFLEIKQLNGVKMSCRGQTERVVFKLNFRCQAERVEAFPLLIKTSNLKTPFLTRVVFFFLEHND